MSRGGIMSRLRKIALAWQQRADQDAMEAVQREIVGSELRLVAHTRRNCAWELLKMLNELEKEKLNRKCTDFLNRMEMTNGGPSFCVEHSSHCADIDPITCEYFAKKQA